MALNLAAEKSTGPKLDVDEYLTTALSATPADLHPFFTAFQELYTRKCVWFIGLWMY